MSYRTLVVAFSLVVTLTAHESTADNIKVCLDVDIARGGIIGTVHLMGEPWEYTWYETEKWDNTQGDWVTIPPELHLISVPGTDIELRFDDGNTVQLMKSDQKNGYMADNIWSLNHAIDDLDHYAVKRTDGSTLIVIEREDDFCGGWTIMRPTILPAGWESHPLAGCLKGAYRATDQFRYEDGFIVADFGDEMIALSYGRKPKDDVIIYEGFDGFRTIRENGPSCSIAGLEELEAP